MHPLEPSSGWGANLRIERTPMPRDWLDAVPQRAADGGQRQAPWASSQPMTAIGLPSGLMKVSGPRKVM